MPSHCAGYGSGGGNEIRYKWLTSTFLFHWARLYIRSERRRSSYFHYFEASIECVSRSDAKRRAFYFVFFFVIARTMRRKKKRHPSIVSPIIARLELIKKIPIDDEIFIPSRNRRDESVSGKLKWSWSLAKVNNYGKIKLQSKICVSFYVCFFFFLSSKSLSRFRST